MKILLCGDIDSGKTTLIKKSITYEKPHLLLPLIAINDKISYIDYSYSNSRKKHGI